MLTDTLIEILIVGIVSFVLLGITAVLAALAIKVYRAPSGDYETNRRQMGSLWNVIVGRVHKGSAGKVNSGLAINTRKRKFDFQGKISSGALKNTFK